MQLSPLRQLLVQSRHAIFTVLGLLSGLGTAYGDIETPVTEWKGADLAEAEGVFYLKAQAQKFPKAKEGIVIEQSLKVFFYSVIERKTFVVSQVLGDINAAPRQVWRLKAGKYEITKLSFVDDQGVVRTWEPVKQGKSFLIKRRTMSNLGLLTIEPLGKTGIKVKLNMQPNSYKSEKAVNDRLLTSVIDAFTGLNQGIIAGDKALQNNSGGTVQARSQLQADVTISRKISMFFKLDLFKHNAYVKQVLQVLTQHDPSLRACYTDALKQNEELKGQMNFSVLFSKSLSSIKKVKFNGGSLTDSTMAQCLLNELLGLNFSVPDNMIGQLTFTFDVVY